ncbi:MAG: glucose-1-phosphate adenylyltransferase [Chlamydiia bacterium]|nr:glucose-1-phosphate adenylyltransferase [Chlamydiia bacterium]MCP5509531.1 glucose-1-phosphate adenylyltransferase [Chlamydiales bacterium]
MRKNPIKSKNKSLTDKVAAIILAGGEGTRLYPLTLSRCKPAVSFGGTYRLIDIPISNALNARLGHIFILSQYLANSLNQHISETYRLDPFQGAIIEMLSPEDRAGKKIWYEGTADAVRKNLAYLLEFDIDYFVILSGDQLYNMDLLDLVGFAKETGADLTVATLPVCKTDAKRMGLMQIDSKHRITDFYEKPQKDSLLDTFELDKKLLEGNEPCYLGSMGIYVFKRQALVDLLTEHDGIDFGKHLIPAQIKKGNTFAYFYRGYWEDIGTIASYYDANLALTTQTLALDLYDETNPIYAHPQHLPSPVIENTRIKDSIIGQGSVIEASEITHSLIGLRAVIGSGTTIHDSIIIGNQFYASPDQRQEDLPPKFCIGKNCQIERAIIDEHTQIGDNVKLINKDHLETYDSAIVYIRDGIIVVPPGSIIPDNFVL